MDFNGGTEKSEGARRGGKRQRGHRGRGGKNAPNVAPKTQKSSSPQREVTNPKIIAKTETTPSVIRPTSMSTTSTPDNNEPMMGNAFTVPGIAGLQEYRKERHFYNDYSGYLTLINASYDGLVGRDRALSKHLCLSMYQYYCVCLLHARLLYINKRDARGQRIYNDVNRLIRYKYRSIPLEIQTYLGGLGDITDSDDRTFELRIQTMPSSERYEGICGYYGKLDPRTSVYYATFRFVIKIHPFIN